MLLKHLENAREKRQPELARLKAEGTNAYRLFQGEREGCPALVIEVFGPVAFFQIFDGRGEVTPAELSQAAQWCAENVPVDQVYLKRFIVDRTGAPDSRELFSPEPLWGPPAPAEFPVTENGKTFLIRPFEGYSVGLFLDQRENRRLLGEIAPGAQVLNLFAYTCAFSVYCAKAGAQVTSVDLSPKYLEWGKANFERNGITTPARFFASDARDFLKGAVKRGAKYDRIVVDPPSFSRGRKSGPFSVKRDLESLLSQCAAILHPEGDLFVSTNFAQWGQGDLDRAVERALGPTQELPLPETPFDFEGANPITCRWVRRASASRPAIS